MLIFIMCKKYDTPNRNGRIYPERILKREADNYKKMPGTQDKGDNLTIKDNVSGSVSYYDLFKKTLNISGKANTPSRIIFDSFSTDGSAYSIVAGRTARGTVVSPSPTQNNDILMRVAH